MVARLFCICSSHHRRWGGTGNFNEQSFCGVFDDTSFVCVTAAHCWLHYGHFCAVCEKRLAHKKGDCYRK